MFENSRNRYITSGVASTVPVEAQLALWGLVDGLRERQELDYLQIFRLAPATLGDVTYQTVEHTQERPPYRAEHAFPLPGAVSAKVYCIDDGEHAIMLLAEEY